MKYRKFITSLAAFMAAGWLSAQEAVISVSAPSQVAVGQQFRLVYSINAEVESFIGPAITDFTVISGPSQSSSSNIQIIGNQITRSVTISYTYFLQATKEGTFTLPAAKAKVDGKQISSESVVIKVTASSAGGAHPQGQAPGQPMDQSGMVTAKDIFLRATASKTNPYQGEEIIITYKLYTRLQVTSYNIDQAPQQPGFWAEELIKDRSRLVQYTEMVDGVQYTVAEIRKVALFPQRAGTLRLEPMQMEAMVQVRRQRTRTGDPFFDSFFFNDPFFGGSQSVKQNLTSNALTFEVKPLPAQNKPATFSGAVGEFTFQASVDRTELKANEGLTLKMTIKGKGNVKLIDVPHVQFPASFETYDPKLSTDIQSSTSGVSGTRSIEMLAIPRSAGKFTISPVAFTFFNPSKAQYVTIATPEFNINVLRGDGSDQAMVSGSVDQQAVQYLATDIRYIKQLPFRLHRTGAMFFGSTWFWILTFGPILFLFVFLLALRHYIRQNSDLARLRNRKATTIARKRLKSANNYLKNKDKEMFFTELAQAIWGYISDKFNLPLSELTLDNVRSRLEKREVKEHIIISCLDTLNEIEFARFAPGSKDAVMEQLYTRALELITGIERDLK